MLYQIKPWNWCHNLKSQSAWDPVPFHSLVQLKESLRFYRLEIPNPWVEESIRVMAI